MEETIDKAVDIKQPFESYPSLQIDNSAKERVRGHYDRYAVKRAKFRKLNWYYHKLLLKNFQFIIPEGARVLEIGCGDGYLLRNLKPSRGVGIDFSSEMITFAKEQSEDPGRNNLEFYKADIEAVRFNEKFDFIVLSDVLGNLLDIQSAFENILTACTESTRIVINFHSLLWEPFLKILECAGLKMRQPDHNWLSAHNVENFLKLAGLDMVKFEQKILFPFYIPLLSSFLNKFIAPIPFIDNLCLSKFFVARQSENKQSRNMSTTILIPCRNEKGNIRNAIERLPLFGSTQEVIFVDGKSTDGTVEEIKRVIEEYKDRDIKVFIQKGTGKADAVRLGFSEAKGDILMILDADLTVPPENLSRFYEAIVNNCGEMVMGCRLVYPLEKQAMRFLNIIGNKLFSFLFSWLLNQKINDTLCGTKVLLRSNYHKILKERDYFGDFDPFGDFELIFGAAKQNLKILEIPIRYRERTYGVTNIKRFAHGLLLLKMFLFALRKIKMR